MKLTKEDMEMNANISLMSGLPWWFTNECRQQLLNIPTLETTCCLHERPESTTPEIIHQMTPDILTLQIKNQLEYYFSRENLINDRYLRCQMDSGMVLFCFIYKLLKTYKKI